MICGQPAEAENNFCKRRATPSHLPESRATGKRHREARRYNNVQQRCREFLALWRNPTLIDLKLLSQRSFWRKWPAVSEIKTGYPRALTNFPNQLRWS